MSGRPRSIPSYCRHRASGQAYVTIGGREIYLGVYGSPESHERYTRIIAENFPNGVRPTRTPLSDGHGLTLNELILAYWTQFVQGYHQKNGKPTERQQDIKRALRPVQRLYGQEPVRWFGPKALQVVRDEIIREAMERRGKINRIYVNDQVAITKRMFQWGVSQELVPVSVHQALLTVESMHKGRDSRVTERKKVLPAPDPHVDAVIAIAPPQIAAMIEVQRLTGMRPDEVTIMRPCDIDRTSEIWLYQPHDHKMDHLDIDKIVLLGPRAQKILEPWLNRPPTEYMFSPAAVCEAAWAKRRKRLKPKPRKRKSKGGKPRRPREHYDDESYCRRVKRLCQQAGVPKWTPHQLRHSAATEIRRKHGLEAARLILGHRSAVTTEIYAEKELQEAIRIMKESG